MKQVGTVPVARELLMMERMLGPAVSITSFRRVEGMISSGQVAVFIVEMSLIRIGSVTGRKLSRLEEQGGELLLIGIAGGMLFLMLSTLLMKKVWKSMQVATDGSGISLGGG